MTDEYFEKYIELLKKKEANNAFWPTIGPSNRTLLETFRNRSSITQMGGNDD